MTELAEYREPEADVPESPLVTWAREAAAAHNIALSLVKTSFVPQSLKGKPEEATAAILTGRELGLEPMTSLRSIFVINETPAMTAIALRSLMLAAGHDV